MCLHACVFKQPTQKSLYKNLLNIPKEAGKSVSTETALSPKGLGIH